MLTKKPSQRKSEIPKCDKSKIMSPQKIRFSPMKSISKMNQQTSRDFFNYTPLRQNKSLNCSTPDLSINKAVKKETNDMLQQKKIILDQGKALHDKLKEFKTKIKSNNSVAFTSRSSFSQLSLFCNLITKKKTQIEKKIVCFGFSALVLCYNAENFKLRNIYKRNLKRKALRGLKKRLEDFRHAAGHYKLQLLVKTFVKWSEVILWRKSNNITKDSSDERSDLSCLTVSDDSNYDLTQVAESLYSSSLKLYKGLAPWKSYVSFKKRKKALIALSTENYKIKLSLKAFSSLVKYYHDQTERPKQIKNIYLLQKVFAELKNFETKNEADERIVSEFRSYTLSAKVIDCWKSFVFLCKLRKTRRKIEHKSYSKRLKSNTLS